MGVCSDPPETGRNKEVRDSITILYNNLMFKLYYFSSNTAWASHETSTNEVSLESIFIVRENLNPRTPEPELSEQTDSLRANSEGAWASSMCHIVPFC